MKLGIIPAAGKAERFGGILKELLPLPNESFPLLEAVKRLSLACDHVIVITSPDKIKYHAGALISQNVIYRLQKGREIWGAIKTGMNIEAERYYMTMPDTLLPGDIFEGNNDSFELVLGVFETYEPERYGVVFGGEVHDKKADEKWNLPVWAWGTVEWSRVVRDHWLSNGTSEFPEALTVAMKGWGYKPVRIDHYTDLARMGDYIGFLKGHKDGK